MGRCPHESRDATKALCKQFSYIGIFFAVKRFSRIIIQRKKDFNQVHVGVQRAGS